MEKDPDTRPEVVWIVRSLRIYEGTFADDLLDYSVGKTGAEDLERMRCAIRSVCNAIGKRAADIDGEMPSAHWGMIRIRYDPPH
jgi:hypothetical protein